MSLSAAKSRVNQAKMQLESNRADDAESTVAAAEKFLEGLPDDETAAVRAELAAIRAAIAAIPKPEHVRALSAAKGKLNQARSQLADRQFLLIPDALVGFDRYMAEVPDAMKAELAAEGVAFREEVARAQGWSAAPAPTPTPVAPERASGAAPTPAPRPTPSPSPAPTPTPTPAPQPSAAPAALSDDDYTRLSRGRSRVNQARSLLESRRTENIESILEEASGFLTGLPASATGTLLADIEAIRAETKGADNAEGERTARGEIDRKLRSAESDIEMIAFERSADMLKNAAARLGEDDIVRKLSSDAIAAYRTRIVELRASLAAAIKADALGRALPLVDELEEHVVDDPFAGKDQHDAYVATNEMNSLELRIRGYLRRIPDGDADVAAIDARLLVVTRKIEQASIAWGKAKLDAQVSMEWGSIEADVAGWDTEEVPADARPLDDPNLPKTRSGVRRTRWFLDSPETKRIRDENPGDATLEANYRAAERIFDGAAARLDAAYQRVLDAAEKLETPLDRFVLDRPSLLAYAAESSLAGTRYQEATVARARALDERWKAEVAAIMKARQELCDKLTAEANEAWPALLASTGAVPYEAGAPEGTVVLLEGVRNRCGWDYGGRYDFAMRFDEETVLAGSWEPHIQKALEHAWYELKIEVSDRTHWDVVAVVERPGKIGVRTTVTLRDKFTNFEIGTIEEWPPIDCIRIRIIALHAGPVAVAR